MAAIRQTNLSIKNHRRQNKKTMYEANYKGSFDNLENALDVPDAS